MSLKVVARRDDTTMLIDQEDGPGAILYRDGDVGVFHIDTALSGGYWEDASDEAPTDLPESAVSELRAFNERWRKAHAEDPTLDEIHVMAAEEPFPAAARARELALLGVTRALGHDVTPGHDELHHYWTRGEGLAKWAESPKPWTTLVSHLTKYVGLRKAKIFASRWFIEVFHFASGSDLNRVTHGKPPRGKRVGPG